MSFNIRSIREVSDSPNDKFVSHLAYRISKLANEQQTQELENKEDIYSSGQDVDSVVKLHSDLISTKTFTFDVDYYPPLEPDFDKLRLWIRGINLGNDLSDFAMRNLFSSIRIHGDPILVDGSPHDDGISTGGFKSLALRMNSGTDTEADFIEVDGPTSTLNASEGLSGGVSFFMRFRVFDLSQDQGSDITLFEKTDNNPITDGIRVNISESGRLKVTFKHSDTIYAWQTATNTIAIDTVYDMWITYKVSDNSIHIYINNVDQSLTSHAGNDFHSDTSNFDYYIFRRGVGTNEGYVYGDLYDFRVYREKIVSAAEVGYMYTNKWTISDIDFGHVMIADYYAPYEEGVISVTPPSFTSSSFTSTSFTQ